MARYLKLTGLDMAVLDASARKRGVTLEQAQDMGFTVNLMHRLWAADYIVVANAEVPFVYRIGSRGRDALERIEKGEEIDKQQAAVDALSVRFGSVFVLPTAGQNERMLVIPHLFDDEMQPTAEVDWSEARLAYVTGVTRKVAEQEARAIVEKRQRIDKKTYVPEEAK